MNSTIQLFVSQTWSSKNQRKPAKTSCWQPGTGQRKIERPRRILASFMARMAALSYEWPQMFVTGSQYGNFVMGQTRTTFSSIVRNVC